MVIIVRCSLLRWDSEFWSTTHILKKKVVGKWNLFQNFVIIKRFCFVFSYRIHTNLYGVSPVWLRTWLLRCSLRKNVLWQVEHAYGLSCAIRLACLSAGSPAGINWFCVMFLNFFLVIGIWQKSTWCFIRTKNVLNPNWRQWVYSEWRLCLSIWSCHRI